VIQESLNDPNVELRTYSAAMLGSMAPLSRDTAGKLTSTLRDKDAHVRALAARALGGVEAHDLVFPALSDALRDGEGEVRVAAADAMMRVATPTDAAFLIETLKHTDPEVSARAARLLAHLGVKSALPAIMAMAKSPEVVSRRACVHALNRFGAEAKGAVPILTGALEDSDADVRASAATALGKFGADAKPGAYALTKAIGDLDTQVRRAAIVALGKVGADPKTAVPALAQALTNNDVRPYALAALSDMGADAKPALPSLIALLEAGGSDNRNVAKVAEILGKVGKSAVKDLTKAMSSNASSARTAAAMALGEIGPGAKDAVRVLRIHATNDVVPDVRQASQNALLKITAKP
jgi:HEAT repeat protein